MEFLEDIVLSSSKTIFEYSSSGSSPPSSPSSGDQVNEHDDGKSPLSNPSVSPETKKKKPEPLPYIFPHDDEDKELIAFFLVKKVFGRRIRFNILIERNPFEDDPDMLPLGWSNSSRIRVLGNEGYYFTIADPTESNQTETSRFTPNGCWTQNGSEQSISGKEYIIGFKKEWEFYWRKESNGQVRRTEYWKIAPNGVPEQWLMHEYRLNPALFLAEITDDVLLLKIRHCRLCRIQHFESQE